MSIQLVETEKIGWPPIGGNANQLGGEHLQIRKEQIPVLFTLVPVTENQVHLNREIEKK